MLQQLIEVLMIAIVAFGLSLGTGKMVSNVVSSMLESTQNNQQQMVMEMPGNNQETENEKADSQKSSRFLDKAMQSPENAELDVSLTTQTIIQLGEITSLICLISVVLPSIYILRLSPREILVKKEG